MSTWELREGGNAERREGAVWGRGAVRGRGVPSPEQSLRAGAAPAQHMGPSVQNVPFLPQHRFLRNAGVGLRGKKEALPLCRYPQCYSAC